MKKTFTLLSAIAFMAFQMQAQWNTVYPGADTSRVYKAPKITTAPKIDGDHTDNAWNAAEWKSAFAVGKLDKDWTGGTPAGKEGDFSGADDASLKYKFVWDDFTYYMLLCWKDDEVIYSDIHDGYMKASQPSWAKLTFPSAGGTGTGALYNSWRMDMLNLMFSNYAESYKSAYSRADNGLWYSFFPAMVNKSTHLDSAVLWAPKHNNPTNNALPSSHKGKCVVACKYDEADKAYYIELKDTTWATIFNSVKTKTAAGLKDFATTPAAVGDKFFFSGEVNDADGITNRRDYSIYIGHMALTDVNKTMAQAVIIELAAAGGGTNVSNASAKSGLGIFPNPNTTGVIQLNSAANVEIYNITGCCVLKSNNSSRVDISALKSGIYLVKDNAGNVEKLVKK